MKIAPFAGDIAKTLNSFACVLHRIANRLEGAASSTVLDPIFAVSAQTGSFVRIGPRNWAAQAPLVDK